MSESQIQRLAKVGLLAFAISGCLAGPDVDAQLLTLAPEVVQPGDGVYEVPVAPELMSFASYPVTKVKWEAKHGVRRLEYRLPDDLAGTSNKVELTGPEVSSDWVLEGEAGRATCSALADQIHCNESLPGVTVDVAAVEARVQQDLLAPQKLEVTKVFNGDPLGILRFAPDTRGR